MIFPFLEIEHNKARIADVALPLYFEVGGLLNHLVRGYCWACPNMAEHTRHCLPTQGTIFEGVGGVFVLCDHPGSILFLIIFLHIYLL